MNSKISWGLPYKIMFASLLLIFLSGCSHMNGFLPTNGALSDGDTDNIPVTTVSTSRIYFQRVSAELDGDVIVITGRVGNHSPVNIMDGHVDAKLYGPDEILIAETSTYQSPRIIRKLSRNHRANRGSKFKLVFQTNALDGSRVVLWFHQQRKVRMAIRNPHKENVRSSNKQKLSVLD